MTSIRALDLDELLRTRRFCAVAIVIAIAGASATWFLNGDPFIMRIVVFGLVVAAIAIGFILTRTRDPETFRGSATNIGWFVVIACVSPTVPYFGAFSGIPIILVLGIYVTALGRSNTLAYAVYIVFAGVQLVASILVIANPQRETGIIRSLGLTTRDQIVVQALVQLVMLATFVTARVSRRATLVALDGLRDAVRIATQRQALLLEARAELDHMRNAGVGRFTGQKLAGYELGALLGRGAMGEVYAAIRQDGSTAAIKLLSHAAHGDRQSVARFLRELETSLRVISPNVVKVYEVGEEPVPYLVMEKLEGVTLAEHLRRRQALGPADVARLLRELANGITAAAAAGIVHRDLKPHNVFDDRGTWKILDFGIARAADDSETLTAGNAVGTPAYMAPEQALGKTVDHCTDIYALAAIAYRCLTGRPPYAASTAAQTIYQVVNARPIQPSDVAPHLSGMHDIVLAIGMACKPIDRFASACELAEAFEAACNGTLVAEVRQRGERLMRAGAWARTRRVG